MKKIGRYQFGIENLGALNVFVALDRRVKLGG